MARKLTAVAFSLGCLHAGSLMALGLGELELESFLNEPLKASVDLLNMGGLDEDQVKVRLAATDDFDKLGLERDYFLTNLTFEVVADGNGGAQIIIRSEQPVLEPYLDFLVEARWPSGRLLREYTVLVDPPVFSQATPVISASERVEEVEGIPAPAKKNEQPQASSSGTQVDIRDSDLAPGAMPQRSYNAQTAGSPAPGSRYMISRDQTLWQIASQARPAGASVHQTMLDIQRLNPDAFINGNINRIKAGYIIYLPGADEISSSESAALAEVREQNTAWREGRDDERSAGSGPSLRISAEPEDATGEVADASAGAGEQSGVTAPDAVSGSADTGAPADITEGNDTQSRVADLEQQLETLQRIVSLKDDQIAALQNALSDPNAEGLVAATELETALADPEIATDADAGELPEPVDVTTTDIDDIAAPDSITETDDGALTATDEVIDTDAVESQRVEIEPEAVPPKTQAPVEEPAVAATTPESADRGLPWMDYLPYGLGILLLAIGGFMLARRRRDEDGDGDDVSDQQDARDDAFSAVQLRDEDLEVEAAEDDAETVEAAIPSRNNRGYGERKHDEYASDVDAADALAEADIYIAYGRHPQAIDLLNNALQNEPRNPVYRLKLLEIYAELNNRSAAAEELTRIREVGDPDSIAQAESLMEGMSQEPASAPSTPSPAPSRPVPAVDSGPGLPPNPLSLMTESDESLEADFSGLEIEPPGVQTIDDDELDLSADFASSSADDGDDEELVIAADSNGLSTKLDLARAYLDMGDDDGARQILEEVVAEGTEELKAEARTLLDRIG